MAAQPAGKSNTRSHKASSKRLQRVPSSAPKTERRRGQSPSQKLLVSHRPKRSFWADSSGAPQSARRLASLSSSGAPRFLFSVAAADKIPPFQPPEVAFFGASNVGKSTLINALSGHRTLAKTSKRPGCTQLLNFFAFPSSQGQLPITFVDVPGYGFASLPPALRQNWETLLLAYLASRRGGLRPYLLLDSRRKLRDHDVALIELLLKHDLLPVIVLTKMDKLTQAEAKAVGPAVQEALKALLDEECAMLTVSAKNRVGIEALRQHIYGEASEGAEKLSMK